MDEADEDRFICTLAVANTMYLAQSSLLKAREVSLNNLTLPFWTDLFPDQQSFTVDEAAERLGKVGDGYMTVARKYAERGRMSEQIDRLVVVEDVFPSLRCLLTLSSGSKRNLPDPN
jgi:hypothetical protein